MLRLYHLASILEVVTTSVVTLLFLFTLVQIITINTKLDHLLFNNISYVQNNRISFVYLYLLMVSANWSFTSSSLSSPPHAGVKQRTQLMCVCHIIAIRVLKKVNELFALSAYISFRWDWNCFDTFVLPSRSDNKLHTT